MTENPARRLVVDPTAPLHLAGYWHDKHEMCFILWALTGSSRFRSVWDWGTTDYLWRDYLGFLEDRPSLADQDGEGGGYGHNTGKDLQYPRDFLLSPLVPSLV